MSDIERELKLWHREFYIRFGEEPKRWLASESEEAALFDALRARCWFPNEPWRTQEPQFRGIGFDRVDDGPAARARAIDGLPPLPQRCEVDPFARFSDYL